MSAKYWDITVNAFRGCRKVSRGCDNCWAERFARRHVGNPKTQALYAGLADANGWTTKTRYDPNWWKVLPKAPKKILFNAMGDFFHEGNPPGQIREALDIMAAYPQHTFMIPTKRTSIAAYHFKVFNRHAANMWILASVEDQDALDARLPELMECVPFVKVGLSAEPLLGHIEINNVPLGWIICGGETGPGARPMHPDWPRSLRDQSAECGIPFFFKQWGPWRGQTYMGAKLAGRELDGAEHNGVPV